MGTLPGTPVVEEQALARIKVQLEQQRGGEALPLIERFVNQPRPPVFIDQFTFLYAVALDAQDESAHAISILEQFLEEHPDSLLIHKARLMLGTLYIETRQPGRAIFVLSRVPGLTSNETTHVEALHQLCLAYELHGDYLQAIQTALAHLEQLEEDEQRDFLDYIQSLILQKMDERSLRDVFDAFSTAYPGDLALIRLIEIRMSQDDEVLAERDIRAFLQRFPDHPYARTATALLQTLIARITAHRHVIAAVFPFSGDMKPFGTEALNGVRLALEDEKILLGANAVGLVVKDSALPPARLRREVVQLLDDFAPVAVIGPLLTREIRLLAGVPDLAAVPFLTPTATLHNVRQSGQYWFSTAMTPRLQIQRMVDYTMRQFGYTRFCILAPQTPHGERVRRLFQQTVMENGGEVVAAEWYTPGTTDASAQMTRIKNRDLRLDGELVPLTDEEPVDPENPPAGDEQDENKDTQFTYVPGFDALFLPGQPTDVAFLAAQLDFLDMNVPLLGTNSWHHPTLLQWGRSSIEGGLFGDALFFQTTDRSIRRFLTLYRERFQSDPSIFAVQAYDAMRAVIDAIRRGATTGTEVHAQLVDRTNIPTLGGWGNFDEGGILTRKVYMIQIQHGQFIQLN